MGWGASIGNCFSHTDLKLCLMRRKKAEEFRTKIRDIALDSFLNIHCMKIQVPKEYSIASCAHI